MYVCKCQVMQTSCNKAHSFISFIQSAVHTEHWQVYTALFFKYRYLFNRRRSANENSRVASKAPRLRARTRDGLSPISRIGLFKDLLTQCLVKRSAHEIMCVRQWALSFFLPSSAREASSITLVQKMCITMTNRYLIVMLLKLANC